ncbi:MAG: FAD-dependent oxidoreductase [Inquilinus sp.]|nr:FAD-dependent oxidoreductase [Inquilinus sp.]
MASYEYPRYSYRAPPELKGETGRRRPVIVVGAGPVGLAAALDLATHGVPVLVLDDDDTVSVGSRAICWAKRSLEILDRVGIAAPMLEKGVTWQIGKVFLHDQQVYAFDLLPEGGHKQPAFINLQQYYVEQFMVEAALASPLVELRFRNKVVGLAPGANSVGVDVETPDGPYRIEAEYVLAADGARSPARKMLGLSFEGKVFEDRFLIADVRMTADFPTERWFWFDPPFHSGGSALLHRQADDIWRIDLQLGWDADPERERQPERVLPRLKAMLGEDRPFELEWVSVYTFQCRRLERFRHDRVLFVGDSAHQVSPFGARGGNGGLQDTDNLAWKLAAVLSGTAPDALLDSYDTERIPATDDNILNSTRSTDFITPKGEVSRAFRDAMLELAADLPFARRLVNSGRLSLPFCYVDSPLNTPDAEPFAGPLVPGAPCLDAPLRTADGKPAWLLERLGGGFTLLGFGAPPPVPDGLPVPLRTLCIGAGHLADIEGLAGRRYDARDGTCYLIRPDQHVAARWRSPDPVAIAAALDRALGRTGPLQEV